MISPFFISVFHDLSIAKKKKRKYCVERVADKIKTLVRLPNTCFGSINSPVWIVLMKPIHNDIKLVASVHESFSADATGLSHVLPLKPYQLWLAPTLFTIEPKQLKYRKKIFTYLCTEWVISLRGFSGMVMQPARHESHVCYLLRVEKSWILACVWRYAWHLC